ncbi:uncharacterized protein LOC127807249 [Diospyros lotus]|uniref:uncharacterized protein LOC127807249 n=1 Tax=Diospyros lotus TaxID=55363 RepID=UPI002257AAEB|nr:uncharacterized protein LOC127807249 [Diospyros lotus]
MAENPKREARDSAEMGTQKISVSDQTNSLRQLTNVKSENFVVDMESLVQLSSKDRTANSGTTMQRSLSRKGSQHRGSSEKKINSSTGDEKETDTAASASPRAAFAGASIPEKPMVVTVGTAEVNPPQTHHQIIIMAGNSSAATAESRWTARRLSFRRSPPWAIDPRRIFFLLATLSSMGTMLLIYFTISMGKQGGDDSAMEW